MTFFVFSSSSKIAYRSRALESILQYLRNTSNMQRRADWCGGRCNRRYIFDLKSYFLRVVRNSVVGNVRTAWSPYSYQVLKLRP